MAIARTWIRRTAFALLALMSVGVPPSTPAESLLQAIDNEVASLLDANRGCVVRIHSIYSQAPPVSDFEFGTGFTHGTGFLFDHAGYILTVDKAVSGAREIRVTLGTGETRLARFIASDPTSDVAVIQIDGEGLSCAHPGDSDAVRVGHYAFILGNAFGNLVPSIGSVYEVNEEQDLIQIATTVHPSYGGAPVFNSSGEVLGMVWAAPTPGSRPTESILPGVLEAPSTVFVIPMKRAERIARMLIREGEMNYGWLGVQVDDESFPVTVSAVSRGGPADRAGVRPGDQILRYAGKPVAGPYHLKRLVMETRPGTQVPIRVKRGSEAMAADVEVTERQAGPEEAALDRIAGLEQELGGLRTMLGLDDSGASTRRAKPSAARDPAQIQSQIRTMEQELLRLREMVQQR